GPSWRMVVSLGPTIEAYGVYPGGQSGNPGAQQFDGFVNDWQAGSYYRLNYLKSPEELPGDSISRLKLEPSLP
ncbi:MAG: penicillin acylase family protein, partial [Bacteroidota bacterium]